MFFRRELTSQTGQLPSLLLNSRWSIQELRGSRSISTVLHHLSVKFCTIHQFSSAPFVSYHSASFISLVLHHSSVTVLHHSSVQFCTIHQLPFCTIRQSSSALFVSYHYAPFVSYSSAPFVSYHSAPFVRCYFVILLQRTTLLPVRILLSTIYLCL